MYYATSGAQVTGAMRLACRACSSAVYACGRSPSRLPGAKARLAQTHPQWDAARGATMMAG